MFESVLAVRLKLNRHFCCGHEREESPDDDDGDAKTTAECALRCASVHALLKDTIALFSRSGKEEEEIYRGHTAMEKGGRR